MRDFIRFGTIVVGVIALSIGFQNCGQAGSIITMDQDSSGSATINEVSSSPGNYSVHFFTASKFICEPFGNTGDQQAGDGLKAELVYLDPQAPLANAPYSADRKNAFKVEEYFSGSSDFVKTEAPIYLSQINVPTRTFDQGFVLSDGAFLRDSLGKKLVEYFALRMKSLLKLSSQDQEGFYELATISDDGSKLYLEQNGSQDLIISNDGAHATSMGCASSLVRMEKSQKIPLTYYYNQGPRYEIANVLAWRYLGNNMPTKWVKSPLCGSTSNNKWWNPNDNSAGELWQQLQSEGFKIVKTSNFELPSSQINPCATQNTNMIIDKRISSINQDKSLQLDLMFSQTAQIKAKLFGVHDGLRSLIKTYDFSSQMLSSGSFQTPGLELEAEYVLEVFIVIPDSGVQVLNEVRFKMQEP